MSELLAQHTAWSEARARLWNARPKPSPRPLLIGPSDTQTADDKPTLPRGAPLDFYAPPGMRFITRFVALKHEAPMEVVTGMERSKKIVAIRNEAIFLIHTHTSRTLGEIADLFGRDHTTIIYAIQKHAGKDPRLCAMKAERDAREVERRKGIDVKVGEYLAAGWLSEGQIAAELDISQSLVHSIAQRRRASVRRIAA